MKSQNWLIVFLFSAIAIFAVSGQTPVRLTNVSGTVFRFPEFRSKFTEARTVDVWLPPGYERDTRRNYPVLYMNDGQNLFSDLDSLGGVEWGVDEAMTRLISQDKISEAIVVAIWSTPKRTLEFMPQKAFDKASLPKSLKGKTSRPLYTNSGSDDYLRFLVRELKPFIDKTYRTRHDRAGTFVMGSSMGALMALYALGEYPQVFGAAACLSTQFTLGRGAMLNYMKRRLPGAKTHRIYFDYGTLSLDRENAPYQVRADRIMQSKGYRPGLDWVTQRFPGEDHTERAWRKRIDVPLIFLLGK